MAAEETLSRWRVLFQRLKEQFDSVGAYLDPQLPDETDRPFFIRAARSPGEGEKAPYVIFEVPKDVLDSIDVDFNGLVNQGVQLAKERVDSAMSSEHGFRGQIRLGLGGAAEHSEGG